MAPLHEVSGRSRPDDGVLCTEGGHAQWATLIGIVAVAAFVRVVFFTGAFGSDETTYIYAAVRLLSGDWEPSEYIGATRYGANLPVALSMKLVGQNVIGAALPAMLASVIEVALVTWLAYRIWGQRAALLVGLVIAFLPLHVHHAGRMAADPLLAAAITLSFVLFWTAERSGSRWHYFATGLAVGSVFWIKEVVLAYSLVFVAFPLAWKKFDTKWLLVFAGACVLVVANAMLFMALSGDPLYLRSVMEIAADKTAGADYVRREISFYFRYLFIDIKHTWLLGYLVAGAVVVAATSRDEAVEESRNRESRGFVWIWAVGLLAVFTFFVASVEPFQLVTKQVNYMTIFLAPLCVLAGWFLSTLKRSVLVPLVAAYVLGGTFLSGLEQQAVRNFVANSKATVTFATENPDATLYIGRNAMSIIAFANRTGNAAIDEARLSAVWDAPAVSTDDRPTFAVVDRETLNWGSGVPSFDLSGRIECWEQIGDLEPEGYGLGRPMMSAVMSAAQWFPGALGSRVGAAAQSYVEPRPASVYRIPATCSRRAAEGAE